MAAGVPVGAFSSTYIGYKDNGQVPNIKGFIAHADLYSGTAQADGTLFKTQSPGSSNYVGATLQTRAYAGWYMNASRISSVYNDDATKVRPAGTGMPYCIKY